MDGIFVAIAMKADLMTGIDDEFHLVRKGFGRVAGNEPGNLHPVFIEELHEPGRTNLARKEAA